MCLAAHLTKQVELMNTSLHPNMFSMLDNLQDMLDAEELKQYKIY